MTTSKVVTKLRAVQRWCLPANRRIALPTAALSLALSASVLAIAVPASQAGSATTAHTAAARQVLPNPPANTWPKIGHDPALTGVSPDPLLSTANAAQLGVKWMAPNGSAMLSSPVVAYNAVLNKSVVYQGTETGSLNAFDAATGKATLVRLPGIGDS